MAGHSARAASSSISFMSSATFGGGRFGWRPGQRFSGVPFGFGIQARFGGGGFALAAAFAALRAAISACSRAFFAAW